MCINLILPARSITWKNGQVKWVSLLLTLVHLLTTSTYLYPTLTFWGWFLCTMPDLKYHLFCHVPQGHSPTSGTPKGLNHIWQCYPRLEIFPSLLSYLISSTKCKFYFFSFIFTLLKLYASQGDHWDLNESQNMIELMWQWVLIV